MHGGETRALFVGPHHHFQRCFGFDVQVIEGAQHLQPGEHAKAAVELATGGLGIDVATGHYRRQVRIAPRATGENIAHRIDADGTARRLGPLHEQVAGLAVEVGQGQSAHPALDRGTELGQVHERLPQAIAVDVLMGGLQNVDGCVHGDLHFSRHVFGVLEAAIASKLAPTGDLHPPKSSVGASLLAMRPSFTPLFWQRTGLLAYCTTRNKSPRPAPSR